MLRTAAVPRSEAWQRMWRSSGRRLRALLRFGPLGLLLLAGGIFGLALLAVALAPTDRGVAAWWPAAGLSVLALAWAPRHRRGAVALTIAVFSGLANSAAGRSWEVAVGFGIANTLEAVVVAWLLVRGGRRLSLTSLEDVFRLCGATAVGVVVMGVGGAVTMLFDDPAEALVTARTVMASHGAAILVMVPVGMQVRTPRAPGRELEAVLQWTAFLLVTVLTFAPGQSLPLSVLPMPALVWGALRLGIRTVTAQLLLLAVLLTWLSRTGGGPFAADLGPGLTSTATLVQAYLVIAALIMLPLAISVAQRRTALEQVAASERLYRLGFSEALLGTVLLRRSASDEDRWGLEIVELNPVAARILGDAESELVGRSWTARLEAGDQVLLAGVVAGMVDGDLPGWHGELPIRSPEQVRWIEVAISPLPDSAGAGMFVAQLVDVTARRAAEERLTTQALQDGLTGLGNRTLLRDRIDLALRTLPDDGSGVAVLFCDLDDFKLVNDSAGHTSGDVVLVEVARRLRGLLRADDVAARPGGDEFVVLRPCAATPAEAEELAGQVLDALGEPATVGGRSFSVGASIGIAWGTPGSSADDLLRDADAAMYAAKGEGKRRAVVYSDEHRARALRAIRVESELHDALARDELELYLQPVVDLVDGGTVAAEALVRWRHPVQGVLPPGAWLDIAESAGLMPQIGAWVLERACESATTWPTRSDLRAPAVHVNVSARQLDEPGFLDVVRGVLTRTGLPPDRLVLEFTETYLDVVSDALLAELKALRDLGIRLAADDYGTGYSPLTRIIELPISMIKIDQLFVAGMLEDVRSHAVVTTLVGLSRTLDLELVAEGVETAQQATALRELGCPAAQGYLWSRPVPAQDFTAALAGR